MQADQPPSNRGRHEGQSSLDAFCRLAAHDLQAPLRQARQMSALVRAYLDDQDTDRARSFAEQIEATLIKMRKVLSAVTELSGLPESVEAPVPVAMADVVHAALRACDDVINRTGAHITIGNLPALIGDPQLLTKAMAYLISNAVTYVDPEVRPRLSISGATGADGRLCVNVLDNGIGIPRDQIDQVFDPLVRHHVHVSHQGGAGMGLAVAQKILAAHGGQITAAPRRHGGMCFTMTFPASARMDSFPAAKPETLRIPELLPEQPAEGRQSRRSFFARPARPPQEGQSPRRPSRPDQGQTSRY